MNMQAYEGYLEDGRFYPIGQPVKIKGRHRVILTVLDEPVTVHNKNDDKVFWAEFDRSARESAHENHIFDDEAFMRRSSGREPIDFSEV